MAPPAGRFADAQYREADEVTAIKEGDPFSVDPALVERGIRGHAITQNGLARYLRSIGIEPLSPSANQPNFDIAWRDSDRFYVGEVKSLTGANEEKQLRLGLGQVLRFAHQLRHLGPTVPVLAVERQPSDPGWIELCTQLGVILTWPAGFGDHLARRSSAEAGSFAS
jgi:hypothetical protein